MGRVDHDSFERDGFLRLLMHRSTDNVSGGIRAAMVYHHATTGTVQQAPGLVTDFVTVRS